MQLTPTVTVLVLFAGVLHAIWNALASRIGDPILAFGLIGGSEAVVAVAVLAVTGLPAGACVAFAVASAVIHVAYNAALLWAYKIGDFGRAYPLARGTAPLLVALGAWLLAGESLAAHQLAGVIVIAGALLSIVFLDGRPGRAQRPAIAAALATGLTIAAYTVVDGLGVRHTGDPAAYLALLMVMQGPVLAVVAGAAGRRRGDRRAPVATDVRAGLAAGVLSMAAYGIVVWAQQHGPLALVSALRETSVISAALIATFAFGEPLARRRVGCAVAVAAGIVLIGV